MVNGGILKKEHYISLVKRNYLSDNETQLSQTIIDEINDVWKHAYVLLNVMGLISEFNDELIGIFNPMDSFFDKKVTGDQNESNG